MLPDLRNTFQPGWVVEGSPPRNNYRVRIASAPGTFEAIRASNVSLAPGATRDMGGLAAGTAVLLYFPPEYPPAVILATLPIQTGLQGAYDLRQRTTRHKTYPPYVDYKDYGENEWPGGVDHTAPGYSGSASPGGPQIWHSFFEAVLKASEKAGVEAHLIDNLLKLIGFNLTVMTGGAIVECLSDTGEYSEVYMAVPYLWKAKDGALLPDHTVGQPIPQHIHLRGYQGDLDLQLVQIQPPTEGDLTAPDGALVFRQRIAYDGSYSVHSAKDIVFAKMNPDQPLLRAGHLANVIPQYPAGITGAPITGMGDYATGEDYGYGDVPLGTAVDPRKLRTTFETTPAELADVTNRYGSVAKGEEAYRRAQHDRTLDNSHLFQRGTQPTAPLDTAAAVTGSDHRGTLQYFVNTQAIQTIWKLCDDGSIVAEVGDSKIVIGPSSIEFYSDHLSLIGETSAVMGANKVSLSAYEGLQLAGEGGIAGYHGTAGMIVPGLVRGMILPVRSQQISTVKIYVYTKAIDATNWGSPIYTSSAVNNSAGYHGADMGVDLSNKSVKVVVKAASPDSGEYLECFAALGAGGVGVSGGAAQEIKAKANMTANDTLYNCVYIDSGGNEGDSLTCKRPFGTYVSNDDIGFLGIDDDDANVFMPANMREEYHMPIVIEQRTDDPVGSPLGRIWMRTDL